MNYSDIIIYIIVFIVICVLIYLLWNRNKNVWDEFQISQLEYFITHTTDVLNDYLFLSHKKQKCFYDNFVENVNYKEFRKILDIKDKTNSMEVSTRIQYLMDNNDYQEFLLKILKYISLCLGVPIDRDFVYEHLNDRILGTDEEKKMACNVIAKELIRAGYTLNQFTYMDKFYVDPVNNKSNAEVIIKFVNFLKKINKWAPKN